jgi:hypothetical protein
MSNLCIFLNARVENSGALAWIGDKGLAPFRYFFNGKTIRVQQRTTDQEIEIHHVASFHKRGNWNSSSTNWNLKSSSTGMIKTALSIVFLIPGFILGATFKGLAYLFSDVRGKHGLAKEHFTPVNREIGSVSDPITTREELSNALDAERQSNPKNRPTNALIIHGDGALTINEDPGILQFNPMKLVLEGATIVHQSSAAGRLDDAMNRTGKWQVNAVRVVSSSNPDNSFAKSQNVNSVDDALRASAPRRSWTSCKRYHMIFDLARPQVV